MPSKTEIRVASALRAAGLAVDSGVAARRMPVDEWPWKTARSRGSPTCDLFLPAARIFVEIKGWMTIFAMAKIAWLSRQQFAYYLFQAGEPDWDPFTDSPLEPRRVPDLVPSKRTQANIDRQVQELVFLSMHPDETHVCGSITRKRLQRYITIRTAQYEAWAGGWP